MTFCEMNWDTTNSTGRIRYAIVSLHPRGGCPSVKGSSQDPAPYSTTAAMEKVDVC